MTFERIPRDTRGNRPGTVDVALTCTNPECPEHDETTYHPATRELGGTFLHDDRALTCPHCHHERTPA